MRWCYATSRDADQWNGNCETKEQAIKEGAREYSNCCDTFFVASGECPDPIEALPDTQDIIDNLACFAGDNWGEIAEDWPEVSDEGKKELDSLLEAWVRKHCPISFFMVDGSKAEEVRIEVKAELVQKESERA